MPRTKKVFIHTFGCQMNEHDSDKMADVLAASEGYEKTADPAEVDLILFNTGSVREKAQEKVFTDLGRVKPLKRARPDVLIGHFVDVEITAALPHSLRGIALTR